MILGYRGSIIQGDDFTLTCYTSDATAEYSWLFTSQQSTQTMTGQNMAITNADSSHQGNYTCEAKTTQATGSANVEVLVKHTGNFNNII